MPDSTQIPVGFGYRGLKRFQCWCIPTIFPTVPRFARETLPPRHAQNPARVGDPDVAMQRLYLWILHLSMITGLVYSNSGTALVTVRVGDPERPGLPPLNHFSGQHEGRVSSHSLLRPLLQVLLRIESNSARQGYQSKREEEAKDDVQTHQNTISHGYQAAKQKLAARHARSRRRIRHHIKGKQHEGDAGHREQGGGQWCTKH